MLAWIILAFLESPAPPELRRGGDAEGGAPIVEADSADPSKVRGIDVDVADTIAKGLGVRARFVQVAFTSTDQSVSRGDFDVGLGGVEETPARRALLAVTIPYSEFREVLAVRGADRGRFRSLGDLKGRKVATLAGTIAYDILLRARAEKGVVPVSYDDDFARDFSTRVAILAEGVVVEEGPPEQVLVHPRHPATRQLLKSKGKKVS